MKKSKKMKMKNENASYRQIVAPSSSFRRSNSMFCHIQQRLLIPSSGLYPSHATRMNPHTHKVQKRAVDAGHFATDFDSAHENFIL